MALPDTRYRTCGWLLKKGGTSGGFFSNSKWHRRYFVLHHDALFYYLSESDAASSSELQRGVIPLRGSGLYSAVHSRYGSRYFEIQVPSLKKKFPLVAESTQEYTEWIRSLVQAIDCLNASSTGAAVLELQALDESFAEKLDATSTNDTSDAGVDIPSPSMGKSRIYEQPIREAVWPVDDADERAGLESPAPTSTVTTPSVVGEKWILSLHRSKWVSPENLRSGPLESCMPPASPGHPLPSLAFHDALPEMSAMEVEDLRAAARGNRKHQERIVDEIACMAHEDECSSWTSRANDEWMHRCLRSTTTACETAANTGNSVPTILSEVAMPFSPIPMARISSEENIAVHASPEGVSLRSASLTRFTLGHDDVGARSSALPHGEVVALEHQAVTEPSFVTVISPDSTPGPSNRWLAADAPSMSLDGSMSIDYGKLAAALKDEIAKDTASPLTKLISQPISENTTHQVTTDGLREIADLRNQLSLALKRINDTEAHIAGLAHSLEKERELVLSVISSPERSPKSPFLERERKYAAPYASVRATHVPSTNFPPMPAYEAPPHLHLPLPPLAPFGSTLKALASIPSPRSLFEGTRFSKHYEQARAQAATIGQSVDPRSASPPSPTSAMSSRRPQSPIEDTVVPTVSMQSETQLPTQLIPAEDILEDYMPIVLQEYANADFGQCISDHSDTLSEAFDNFLDSDGALSVHSFLALLSACGVVQLDPSLSPGQPTISQSAALAVFQRLAGSGQPTIAYAQFLAALLMVAVVAVENNSANLPRVISAAVHAGQASRLRFLIEWCICPFIRGPAFRSPANVEMPEANRVMTVVPPLTMQEQRQTNSRRRGSVGPAVAHNGRTGMESLSSRTVHDTASSKQAQPTGRPPRQLPSASIFDLVQSSGTVLPRAVLAALSPGNLRALSIPDLREVLTKDQKALRTIFQHYAGFAGITGAPSGSARLPTESGRARARSLSLSSADGSVISLASRTSVGTSTNRAALQLSTVSKFGLDFNVWPAMMSQGELLRLAVEVVEDGAVAPEGTAVLLDFAAFMELIARVAIVSFVLRGSPDATPGYAGLQLLLFFDASNGRTAMMKGRNTGGAQLRFAARFSHE